MTAQKSQLIEHLKQLGEAVKLVVDRACTLLVFLLEHWLETREQRFTVPVIQASSQGEKFLSVKEAAQLYHVQENTIYELVDRKEIPSVKIGKSIRILRLDPYQQIDPQQNRATKSGRNMLQ